VYVQTTNIDGESDYKRRLVPSPFISDNINAILNYDSLLEIPPPNANMNNFDSRLFKSVPSSLNLTSEDYSHSSLILNKLNKHFSSSSSSDSQYSLSIENLVLQATTIRNTDWVIGLAVYTGLVKYLLLNCFKINKLMRLKLVVGKENHLRKQHSLRN
jgi:hypothetical protein